MATTFALPTEGVIFRGDTIPIQVAISQGGVALNLTGYAITFTAKKDIKDPDGTAGSIQKTIGAGITVVNAARGEIDIVIDSADTSGLQADTTFVCDIQLKKLGVVSTAAIGTLAVTMDVTQTN